MAYSNEGSLYDKRTKRRHQGNATKTFSYDVSDNLCDRIDIEDVKKSSGAHLDTHPSSEPGKTRFVIRGTRGQIRQALKLITTCTGEKETCVKVQNYWLDWVEEAFPDLESHTYFLPPVFIRRVPVTKKTVAGQSVFVLGKVDAQTSCKKKRLKTSSTAVSQPSSTPSVQPSDIADDEAFQRVMFSLKKLSKEQKEIFMCLSQFPFGSYLGEPSYAPAVSHLPSPTNLPSDLPWKWRQGDFDVLLIHRKYGFVVFEVKAVTNNSEASLEKRIEQVTKKLKEAVKQLNKAEAMLSHLTSDIAHNVRITKTIACPNLTSQELRELISQDEQLLQDICECFKVETPADVVRLILCSDHLCSPETPPPDRERKMQALKQWWQERVCGPREDSQFTFDMYRSIIARFCGPASTVTVPCTTEPRLCIKTISQAVAHVGDCYTAYMTLFPEQIELLTRAPPRVFIAGPPGTGKTTVLILMALKWLQDGSNVYVLSTWKRSLATTLRFRHLIQVTLKTQQIDENTAGHVIFVNKNFLQKEEVEEVLNDLARVARRGPLYVIADEVGPDFESEYYIFPEFCASLHERCRENIDNLHFWAASDQDNVAPEEHYDRETEGLGLGLRLEWEGWELLYFTRPLRSPPSVIREVQLAVEIRNGTVPEYSKRNVPDHADDLPVEWVYHRIHGHGYLRVEDCAVCGQNVATFLCTEVRLGVSEPGTTGNQPATSRPSPVLKYKDVLVLSWVKLREDAPLLKALSEAGVPVRVMSEEDIEDVATAKSDVVWAAQQQLVCGLMRKVVVVMSNYDDSKGVYVFTRLRAMSRCSSQLVVVCPPPGYEPD